MGLHEKKLNIAYKEQTGMYHISGEGAAKDPSHRHRWFQIRRTKVRYMTLHCILNFTAYTFIKPPLDSTFHNTDLRQSSLGLHDVQHEGSLDLHWSARPYLNFKFRSSDLHGFRCFAVGHSSDLHEFLFRPKTCVIPSSLWYFSLYFVHFDGKPSWNHQNLYETLM